MWGKRHGYKPAYIRYKLRAKGLPTLNVTHWVLAHKSSGALLDATASQFTSRTRPDYTNVIGCGFLTKKPSKRARQIMRIRKQRVSS